MKLTKTRLRCIIKEEINALFEVAKPDHEKPTTIDIAKKESEDGVFVDLPSLVNLIVGQDDSFEVGGIDRTGPAGPSSMSLNVSITDSPPRENLPVASGHDVDKVFVPTTLFGHPFRVAHPQYGNYSFVVKK